MADYTGLLSAFTPTVYEPEGILQRVPVDLVYALASPDGPVTNGFFNGVATVGVKYTLELNVNKGGVSYDCTNLTGVFWYGSKVGEDWVGRGFIQSKAQRGLLRWDIPSDSVGPEGAYKCQIVVIDNGQSEEWLRGNFVIRENISGAYTPLVYGSQYRVGADGGTDVWDYGKNAWYRQVLENGVMQYYPAPE